MRQRRQSGFTLVELMVVVALVGIMAAIAIPRLGGAGMRARATSELTRKISLALEQARTRAMAERKRFRVNLNSTQIQTQSTPDNGITWVTEMTVPVPGDASVWDVLASGATVPSAITTSTHYVQYYPNFTIDLDGGPNVNAFIFVGPTLTTSLGNRYLINLVASGSQTVADRWN